MTQPMSLVIQMDEEKEKMEMETETYPIASLFGDIGGAGGLFLGLSVVGADFEHFWILKIFTFDEKFKFLTKCSLF